MAGSLNDFFTDASRKSGVDINMIDLRVLSYAQQGTILDGIPLLGGMRCCAEAKELLSLLGGHPRLLEFFINAITNKVNVTGTLKDIDWKDIERTLEFRLRTATWSSLGYHPQLAE